MTTYLQARGLAGDSRVNSSYMWSTDEMIAEDYRQLLGSPNASATPGQSNYQIPLANAVPGLRDFLLNTFTAAPAVSASPTPSPSASPTAAPTASPTAAPATSPTATPSPSPSPTRKGGGGCKRAC